MNQVTFAKHRDYTIKFYATEWNEETLEAKATELDAIEAYLRAAKAQGLTDEELSEDLAAQWGHLGNITVLTVKSVDHAVVWVDIEVEE